jgi:HlyD family secretion protein
MKTKNLIFLILTFALILSSCDILLEEGTQQSDTALQASGVVEAIEIVLAPEIGGRVAAVFVAEGARVEAEEILFQIEDKLLESQFRQSATAVAVAQANYDLVAAGLTAEQKGASIAAAELELAAAQHVLNQLYENNELMAAQALQMVETLEGQLEDLQSFDVQQALVLQTIANAQKAVDTASRNLRYKQSTANSYDIDAAKAELILAEDALEDAVEDFEEHENKRADNLQRAYYLSKKAAAEKAFEETQRRVNSLSSTGNPIDIAVEEGNLVAAEAQLAQAQREWERIKDGPNPGDIAVLEAQIALAQNDYDILKDGPDPDDVAVAQARVTNAEAQLALAKSEFPTKQELAVTQAHLEAAQANLDAIQVQIELLIVTAPVGGVVMTRNVEPGEVIQPGLAVLTIGQLDQLTITVYIAEDKYGQINLGDAATLTADSFPNEIFSATVTRIADRAEYTPRNVQTKEDRQTTVYALELAVKDPEGKLKPGMPTDVVFGK